MDFPLKCSRVEIAQNSKYKCLNIELKHSTPVSVCGYFPALMIGQHLWEKELEYSEQ